MARKEEDDENIEMEDNTNNPTIDPISNNYNKSSTSSSVKMETSSPSQSSGIVFTTELLKKYYERLFPFALMYQWLSYDPKQPQPLQQQQQQSNKVSQRSTIVSTSSHHSSASSFPSRFHRREISFTLLTSTKEEIYLRYQCFTTMEKWQQAMVEKVPIKIDLGAMWSHPPSDHKSVCAANNTTAATSANGFKPVERELVLDLDISDYDEIRHCGCSGASQICSTCWHYLDMAQDVLDTTLREDFGFVHIAWFYSGRRGIHAWVCDARARSLSNEARSALASYLEVNLGSERNQQVHLSNPVHPMLERSIEILEPYFIKYVLPETGGHGLLATPERWTKDVLNLLPSAAQRVCDNLTEQWEKEDSTPQEKWAQLKLHVKNCHKQGRLKESKIKRMKTVEAADLEVLEHWTDELVLKQTYPRLDVNVTKMQNHLLKSPFCVHPKTGRVCVYMPRCHDKQTTNNKKKKTKMTSTKRFDPFTVPTLAQVINELDEYHKKQQQQQQMQNNSNDGDNSSPEDGGVPATTASTETLKFDWQKTSLRPYMEAFEKEFLQPLLKELRQERRTVNDEEAALRGDF